MQDWIPINSGLPKAEYGTLSKEVNIKVLYTDKNGNSAEADYTALYDHSENKWITEGLVAGNVIAWRDK